tara:strand:+ start:139 stop:387 length:249 start_codon:yes stop_codon:yes gene_type:complete
MKNRLYDLNNHLFMQMERLTDEELDGEKLTAEIRRAAAVVSVADQIVENAKMQLSAQKFIVEHGEQARDILPMIEAPKETLK